MAFRRFGIIYHIEFLGIILRRLFRHQIHCSGRIHRDLSIGRHHGLGHRLRHRDRYRFGRFLFSGLITARFQLSEHFRYRLNAGFDKGQQRIELPGTPVGEFQKPLQLINTVLDSLYITHSLYFFRSISTLHDIHVVI